MPSTASYPFTPSIRFIIYMDAAKELLYGSLRPSQSPEGGTQKVEELEIGRNLLPQYSIQLIYSILAWHG